MTLGPRTRKATPKLRLASVRTGRAANDGGQPTSVGVILVSVSNANTVRRQLGFDLWGGAFLTFVSRIKASGSGGRVSQFAWDTVCLVFDAITDEEFQANFKALAKVDGSVAGQPTDSLTLQFMAGAALGTDEFDALDRAEQALTDAQLRGLSMIASPDTKPRGKGSVDLASDLALAVPRDELFVVYQPKVHVRQRAVSSAEALIRWQHPVLGLVMPDAFISLADESGEMRAITLWTLRRVIADQRRLAKLGHQHFRRIAHRPRFHRRRLRTHRGE
jgi:diguanylate cyclase